MNDIYIIIKHLELMKSIRKYKKPIKPIEKIKNPKMVKVKKNNKVKFNRKNITIKVYF